MTSIEDMFMGALNSTQNLTPIAKAFTDAAYELFPDNYTAKEAIISWPLDIAPKIPPGLLESKFNLLPCIYMF